VSESLQERPFSFERSYAYTEDEALMLACNAIYAHLDRPPTDASPRHLRTRRQNFRDHYVQLVSAHRAHIPVDETLESIINSVQTDLDALDLTQVPYPDQAEEMLWRYHTMEHLVDEQYNRVRMGQKPNFSQEDINPMIN